MDLGNIFSRTDFERYQKEQQRLAEEEKVASGQPPTPKKPYNWVDVKNGNQYLIADEASAFIEEKLRGEIKRYADSLGMSLDPTQIQDLVNKTFTNKPNQNIDLPSINQLIDEARQFIIPNLYNLKTNPATSPDHSSKAGEVLKNILGRDATADELAFFGKELAQGKSAYELQQELMSLPEYQMTLAKKNREQLSTELLDQQQRAFQKAMPEILSQFAQAGRLGSSGLESAMAKAQAELEGQRQGYLAQVGAQNMDQIRQQAYGAFQNYNSPFQQTYNPANIFNAQFGMAGQNLQRQREVSDYERQANDYLRALNASQRNNGIPGALQGGLGGALAGFQMGGGPGAAAGGFLGSLGGYYGTRRGY